MSKWFKKKEENADYKGTTESVFSELIASNRRLTLVVIILCVIIIFAVSGLKKPPITIRLYANGNHDIIRNIEKENKVLAQEFPIFVSRFIRDMNLIDSYHLKDRLSHGVSMMNKSLQKEYLDDILTKENLQKIKKLKWETVTKLGKPKFSKKGDYILCEVVFVRDITDNNEDVSFSQTYRADLKLDLVERSEEYPFGISVRAFDYEQFRTNAN